MSYYQNWIWTHPNYPDPDPVRLSPDPRPWLGGIKNNYSLNYTVLVNFGMTWKNLSDIIEVKITLIS